MFVRNLHLVSLATNKTMEKVILVDGEEIS